MVPSEEKCKQCAQHTQVQKGVFSLLSHVHSPKLVVHWAHRPSHWPLWLCSLSGHGFLMSRPIVTEYRLSSARHQESNSVRSMFAHLQFRKNKAVRPSLGTQEMTWLPEANILGFGAWFQLQQDAGLLFNQAYFPDLLFVQLA